MTPNPTPPAPEAEEGRPGFVEDPSERRAFDQQRIRLYGGSALRTIAACLGVQGQFFPEHGSHSQMLKIQSNECAKAADELDELRAEREASAAELSRLKAEVERLREILRECGEQASMIRNELQGRMVDIYHRKAFLVFGGIADNARAALTRAEGVDDGE